MGKLIVLVILAAFMLAADAHDLTKTETGREVVSQCYAHCARDLVALQAEHEDVLAAHAQVFTDLAGRAARSGINVTDMPEFHTLINTITYAECDRAQWWLNSADLCDASCRDLEYVYGAVNSWAKTRFRYHFENIKTWARASGLWTNYRDWPRPGSDSIEFETACAVYLDQ